MWLARTALAALALCKHGYDAALSLPRTELAELSLQYDYEPLVAPDCPLLMLEPTRLASKYNASG